jgi:hypothetical protein
LENVGGVKSGRIRVHIAGRRPAENARRAASGKEEGGFGTVKCVGQESKGDGGVVVEDSVAGANDGLAVAPRIPGNSDTGLDVF